MNLKTSFSNIIYNVTFTNMHLTVNIIPENPVLIVFRYLLEIVQDLLMFLFRSSAVEGTYSFALVFFFPLLGMNSLTHSPLAAAISLKINKIRFDQKQVNYFTVLLQR